MTIKNLVTITFFFFEFVYDCAGLVHLPLLYKHQAWHNVILGEGKVIWPLTMWLHDIMRQIRDISSPLPQDLQTRILIGWWLWVKSSHLKSGSHLPKKFVLFASLKVLEKWWRMLFTFSKYLSFYHDFLVMQKKRLD